MFSAEVILDSQSAESDSRVTTMKCKYPKFIHGEFMTHRVFSRNASSSRAIPVKKMLEEVRSDELRAAPVWWGKNQAGMQAAEALTGDELWHAKSQWQLAAFAAADHAERLMSRGVHKQITNRILEPFLHINVIVTATEWANFFALRLSPDAQPEMRELARCMFEAYKASTPELLKHTDWHVPFVGHIRSGLLGDALAISTSRCARVSYESFETGRISTLDEDLTLSQRLRTSGHMSPFEHQCTPDKRQWDDHDVDGPWAKPHQHGNLIGFIQYRKMLPNEDVAIMPEGYTL